jgi:hypothetical protein
MSAIRVLKREFGSKRDEEACREILGSSANKMAVCE